MNVRSTVLLVVVIYCAKVLCAEPENAETGFELVSIYNDSYCSDDADVLGPVRSDLFCAHKCSSALSCKGIFYNTITRVCSIVNSAPETTNECQTQTGSLYYKRLVCVPSVALVTGIHGISDDKITASSFYGFLAPEYGRLDSNSAWMADSNEQHHYIQFQFENKKIVNEVITQGFVLSDGGLTIPAWVTTYKIHYSDNCQNFTELNQVFDGNSDAVSKVSNVIYPEIEAMCVRVSPHTYHSPFFIAMRVELMGFETGNE